MIADVEKIDFDDSETLIGYKKIIVSFFDHWLDENEARDCNFICFNVAKNANNLVDFDSAIYKFEVFFENIFEKSKGFYFYSSKHASWIFSQSKQKMLRFLRLYLRERSLNSLLFFDGNVVIEFGFDLTHIIYVHKEQGFLLDQIVSNLNNCDLFVLHD